MIVHADAKNMDFLENKSVDLVITSPPYFNLRGYTDNGEVYDGQIGNEPTPEQYVNSLLDVMSECVRVLKDEGSIWVNLGDKYNKKSLLGLPWRFALRCTDELKLILRAEIIWEKPAPIPETVQDRVRRTHETWFHFVKKPKYYYNVAHRILPHQLHLSRVPGSVWTVGFEPLRVPEELNTQHFAAFPSEFPRRIILGWSPPGICSMCSQPLTPRVRSETVTSGGISTNHADERNTSATSIMRTGRYAQKSLVGWSCGCSTGDAVASGASAVPSVVLDPFGGTGTTAMTARALGRTGISVDMSHSYCAVAQWRVSDETQLSRVRNMTMYGTRTPTQAQKKAVTDAPDGMDTLTGM